MLAKCGILQANPTRRVVNIRQMTTVAAPAVDTLDLAGSRRERADGWSADVIGVRLGAVNAADRTPWTRSSAW
jgi:hypothetical protein